MLAVFDSGNTMRKILYNFDGINFIAKLPLYQVIDTRPSTRRIRIDTTINIEYVKLFM